MSEGKCKKLMVIYAGGTIGMQENENGVLCPAPNTFLEKLKSSELHDAELAEQYRIRLNENQLILSQANLCILYEILEYTPLLDSSDMTHKEWIRIAKDVEKYYDDFDGFVILHGTDTMAYTSSALSFMLDGLNKPVVVTGSQIPIFQMRSDAKVNFLEALIIAASFYVPEVCVVFSHKLFRGNRVSKVSSTELEAFYSPNYQTLADIGVNIKINHQYPRSASPNGKLRVHTNLNPNVAVLTFFPTITGEMLDFFLNSHVNGLVIQSYGAGNLPSNRSDLINSLRNAVDRKILIVNVTQCSRGTTSSNYKPGKVLEEIGIISGGDMTTEAALTKLTYVLGIPGLTFQQRIQEMKTNLKGELTQFDLKDDKQSG